jgi:hypothetical protein
MEYLMLIVLILSLNIRLCWEFAFGANAVKFYSEQVFDPDIHRRGRDEGA